MENFFYEGVFFPEISDLMDYMNFDEEDLKESPDDFFMISPGKLEPFFNFDINFIMEAIENTCDERYSEEATEVGKAKELMLKHIDFDAINAEMPMLYYAGGEVKLTYRDILNNM